MDPQVVVMYIFLLLTVAFAAMLLWRLRPAQTRPEPAAGQEPAAARLRGIQPTSAGEDAAKVIEALGEAVDKLLSASATFGKAMNTIGPTAIVAVFTAFFGFLTTLTALIHR